MEEIRIEGEKIYLRSITIEDSAQVIRWRNSDFVRQFFVIQKDFTMDSQRRWIEEEIDKKKAVQFIIVRKQEEKNIGSVYLRDIDEENHKAEYGVFIGERVCLGKGYGTEAAELMTEYGFDKLHLHKIFLHVLVQNERARSSYRKAGFVEEAVLRDEVCINGVYQDMVRMAKFAESGDSNT